MRNRPGKSLTPEDRAAVRRDLDARASTGNFAAIRLRALVILTWCSGLRLSESTVLELPQVIEGAGQRRWRIVSRALLRADQAKREKARRFYIPREARTAIRQYLEVARKKNLVSIPGPPKQALFPATKKPNKGQAINVRTIELQWQQFQRRAGIVEPYRWHDLRHEAASVFARQATNPYQVRDFLGVKSLATAGIYVHSDQDEILEIAEKASAKNKR